MGIQVDQRLPMRGENTTTNEKLGDLTLGSAWEDMGRIRV